MSYRTLQALPVTILMDVVVQEATVAAGEYAGMVERETSGGFIRITKVNLYISEKDAESFGCSPENEVLSYDVAHLIDSGIVKLG